MDTVTILKEVRDLLSDPARWTRGTAARNRHGYSVDVTEDCATRWCLIGAITKVCASHNNGHKAYLAKRAAVYRVMEASLRSLNHKEITLIDFNDVEETTHADILKLLDSTITTLKS